MKSKHVLCGVLQQSMLQHTVQSTSVAQINLQQRAPWMLSIYSSWLRFLKGIRGFLRMPCSVFRGKGPIFSDWELSAALLFAFLTIKQQWLLHYRRGRIFPCIVSSPNTAFWHNAPRCIWSSSRWTAACMWCVHRQLFVPCTLAGI